jgi:DNA-binding protein HU-beta
MNKSHLIAHVADELRTSKLQAALLVETVLGGIKRGLETDQSVTLTGFGTFQLKPRKARVGRNPHSGEPIEIGPGLRVGFRVGKALKESF